ncbi:hypothetical protein ACI8AC_17525 [Geodermatophilus sp. SYSU D00758]
MVSELSGVRPVRTAAPEEEGAAVALLRRFEPVVRLTRGELFLPGRVEDYLARAAAVLGTGASARVVADPGTLTPQRLAELGRTHPDQPLSLRYVQRPLDRRELRSWRREEAPAPLRRGSGAAAAGLLARLVAVAMRLSLLLRGPVPGGWTAAAHRQSRAAADPDACHCYGRVVRDGGYVVLQYWFFYAMNDWRSSFGGVNDHEADWEHVAVVLAEEEGGPVPAWVVFASHDEVGADLRRRWDDPDLQRAGEHPVVFVGAGSHSAAYLPGDYLVTAAPDLPRWVDRLRRAVGRIVPWADPDASTIGIPFLDYRRGDGPAIGPGQERAWQLHLVDDDTDWVRDFRGLWGLDTGDPFGGERAPAGPRYERDGSVRRSWGAPLAWSQLDGEPATPAEARRLWQVHGEELAGRLAVAAEELDAARAELREATVADRVAGRGPREPGAAVVRLRSRVAAVRARQVELTTELDAWERRAGSAPVVPGPWAHLRHRALPLTTDVQARARVLRIWASASSTLLFAALGVLLLVGGDGLLVPAAITVGVVLGVEALLRGQLVALAVNLALLAVVVVAVWASAVLLVSNARLGAGVLLLLGATWLAGQTVADAFVQRRSRRR